MKLVSSLCALGALGAILVLGAGCGHYDHDHYDDRPIYNSDRVYYHDDYRGGPRDHYWHHHHDRNYRHYDRGHDRNSRW
jgi:hypothetical protein